MPSFLSIFPLFKIDIPVVTMLKIFGTSIGYKSAVACHAFIKSFHMSFSSSRRVELSSIQILVAFTGVLQSIYTPEYSTKAGKCEKDDDDDGPYVWKSIGGYTRLRPCDVSLSLSLSP